MATFSHLDGAGQVQMVDVSDKPETARTAIALARVRLTPAVAEALAGPGLPKGDLYAAVRIAAIQGAKRCAELIPLCHPLPLAKVSVDVEFDREAEELLIAVFCRTTARTGVEMEALTGAAVGALTAYDMVKGIDKGVVIGEVRLLEKTGGASGDWRAES
ncbi:MAG: cyclic pyranopterin monophosphate synthase accessory protein [Porticoccaceae bacterium]|nr:MAG: cyclic pyranopterin monophosphate synthase accessory protein [Porticoccaceae bacterium]